VRVISPHLAYSVQVFTGEEKREVDPITGQAYTRTERMPLVAEFEQGGLFPHEADIALREFDGVWKGLPEGVNPLTRVSIYDTEVAALTLGWSEEYHAKVDERLRVLAANAPTRLLVVEDVKAPKPWPKYDDQDADEIIAYVEVLGIDVEIVLAYERENENRKEIISALTKALKETEAAVAVVSA